MELPEGGIGKTRRCFTQMVRLEGKISRKSALKSLSEGHQPAGDQIPWKFCEQFQDNVFPSLSGARIVRIIVHPAAMRHKYGSTAVKLLTSYYEGKIVNFMDDDVEQIEEVKVTEAAEKSSVIGEHTCMVLKPLNNDELEYGESHFLAPFFQDFRQRFRRLLGITF